MNNKVLLLLITIILTVFLSGCLGSEKKNNTSITAGDYRNELSIGLDYTEKENDAHDKAADYFLQGNYSLSSDYYKKAAEYGKKSYEHHIKATKLMTDPNMKEFWEYMSKYQYYFYLSSEKKSELVYYLSINDSVNAEKNCERGYGIHKNIDEMAGKSQKT